jgi:hypothetical protein
MIVALARSERVHEKDMCCSGEPAQTHQSVHSGCGIALEREERFPERQNLAPEAVIADKGYDVTSRRSFCRRPTGHEGLDGSTAIATELVARRSREPDGLPDIAYGFLVKNREHLRIKNNTANATQNDVFRTIHLNLFQRGLRYRTVQPRTNLSIAE